MPNDPIIFNGNNQSGNGENALKKFQLSGDTKNKSDQKFGEKIILQVEDIINSGYFSERNIRFALNRAMYAGKLDTKKFMDFFNINGKVNYINLSYKAIMIVNTIVSRLVGRWMTKKQKATVTATDPISIKQKKDEYDNAEFYLDNKDKLGELSQASGVNVIPQNAFIPDDKDHLDLWAREEQKLPEEFTYEIGINGVFEQNGWGDMGINTRKIKIDSAVVGLIGKETIADKNGKIQDNYCKPENIFYSYSERDDFSDADIKGEIVSYKLSQLRDMYPKLSINELWEIAKVAKQWTANNKISFDPGWNTSMFLPFDDWNVDVVRFTLETIDVDKSLIKTAKNGSLYVDKPKKSIEDVYPGNEYVEKTITNIYRGIYVRQTKKILYWGLEKNMIKPQDYAKISEAKSPYSFYMYQNTQMRNLAVPEKIEEPVEMMILTRLKIQQFIAKMRPNGLNYDISGLQAMDLGNGIVTPLELQKITDQTGNVYYRSRDAEGNRLDKPITENPNAAGISKLQELIETYNFHQEVLRGEIGINEFAEGQTIQPRTGQQNVQTSLEISFNATDYMNDACTALMNESADKIACLLHDSVEFGSQEYRQLMDVKDVKQREFKVEIEMLPTTEDITNLENDINNAMFNQPDLVLYLDPQKIKRIARKNVKLASQYFRQGQRRAIEGQMKMKQQDSQMNAQLQQESNAQAAEKAIQLQKDKLAFDKEMQEFISNNKKQELLLEKGLELYKVLLTPKTTEGGATTQPQELPPSLNQLLNMTFENIALTLSQDNKLQKQQIIAEAQAEQEAMMGEQQAMQEQPM